MGDLDSITSKADGATQPQRADTRCSIRPKGKVGGPAWGLLLPGEILKPLIKTGLVFQYTPLLTFTTNANWQPQSFGHTNYSYNSWENSDVAELLLSADFTAESEEEAKYMLAMIHFLKSSTKGGFGINDTSRGVPPAVYNFNYLGELQFKDVPVVITSATITYDNKVDYIAIEIAGKETFVPTFANVTVMLKPQYNPSILKKEFSVSNFRNGNYLKSGGGLL